EIIVGADDLNEPSWQTQRQPGTAWAIIAIATTDQADPFVIESWVRLVRVAFRPTRLVVLLPPRRLGGILSMVQAGADGALPATATIAELIDELEGEGVRREDYFPDPQQWLASLRRVSEELILTDHPLTQMVKLLRI